MKTKFFILLIITLFYSIFFIQNVNAVYCSDNGVLAIWRFDEGSGDKIYDVCFNYSGQIYGSPNWIDGKSNKAVSMDGLTNYIDLSPNINDTYQEFAFSFWVNFTPNNVYFTEAFLQKGEYSSGSFIDINYNNGDNNFLNIGTDYGGVGVYLDPTIQDGKYHNIVGVYNGNIGYTELYVDSVFVGNSTASPMSALLPSTYPFYIGVNYNNGWLLNGSIDELILFNRSLSMIDIQNLYINYSCSNVINPILSLTSFPYADFNTTFDIKLSSFPSSDSKIKIRIIDPNNNDSVFDMTYDGISSYTSSFIFTDIGDYTYEIYGDNICPTIINNISGMIKVRIPYYVTVQAFENRSTNFFSSNRYINDFGQVMIQPIDFLRSRDYNTFMTPLTYPSKPVFHGDYLNGISVIKLYEPNQSYIFRLIDGEITYKSEYSIPNITRTYGVNIFLGQVKIDGNTTVNFLLLPQDIRPYQHLFNILFFVLVVGSIILGMLLFFNFPMYPLFAVVLGIVFPIMFLILRVVLWFVWY